jgi:hypothetical protein
MDSTTKELHKKCDWTMDYQAFGQNNCSSDYAANPT